MNGAAYWFVYEDGSGYLEIEDAEMASFDCQTSEVKFPTQDNWEMTWEMTDIKDVKSMKEYIRKKLNLQVIQVETDESEKCDEEVEKAILSISPDTAITLTVHGETNVYKPYCSKDGSWDMKVVGRDDIVYGLSCCNIRELRAMLLADYANGTIANAYIS